MHCLDGVLCQTNAEPAVTGANVQLAYMNRGGNAQKEKGLFVNISSVKVQSKAYCCLTPVVITSPKVLSIHSYRSFILLLFYSPLNG